MVIKKTTQVYLAARKLTSRLLAAPKAEVARQNKGRTFKISMIVQFLPNCFLSCVPSMETKLLQEFL